MLLQVGFAHPCRRRVLFPRREESCGIRVTKRKRFCVTLIRAAGFATLMLGCRARTNGRVRLQEPLGTEQRSKAPRNLHLFPKRVRWPGLIPSPRWRARARDPRSDAADAPQTSEKIVLGLRLFFNGRCSVEEGG